MLVQREANAIIWARDLTTDQKVAYLSQRDVWRGIAINLAIRSTSAGSDGSCAF